MYRFGQGCFRHQLGFLREQFLQDSELPFSNVLSTEIVTKAMTAVDLQWNDRIYTPLVTLWIFLGQVMSADHSCRAAVARFIAHRISRGQSACSAKTSAYCQARKRLPEELFSHVARLVGKTLAANVGAPWLWKDRHVYMFDGTTVTMPATRHNQAAYPQVYNQKPGLGFPIARVCAIMSLSCGAVLDLGICRYAGKRSGRDQSAAKNVGNSISRRHPFDRFSALNLVRNADAQTEWRRLRQPTQQGNAERRLSTWQAFGKRRPRGSMV